MRPRRGVVVGLLVGCVIVAGCGSDSSDSSSEEPPAARDTTVQPASSDVGSDAPEVMPSADHVREREREDAGVLRGTFTRLNGERDDLSSYRGRVVLVVNTATECGFTPQFEGLEALYKERRSDGFVVLGFPANDFAQESRSDDEIAEFCKANYGVTFPMFAKSEVTGDGANALFGRLNEAAGEPEWNFNKYLVDRCGKVVARFGSGTEPDGAELAGRLEKLL